MKKASYKVLGVMSGTSLDGIDIVYVNFRFKKHWSFKVLEAETVPYPLNWQETLSSAIDFSEQRLKELDEKYTGYLADVLSRFIESHRILDLDAICSHGHTIKHEPERKYTLQIGNQSQLAYLTGQKVVCDFRVQDVVLGGQGAPLVPIGDRLLFPEFNYCLNLGGFANVSTEKGSGRLAYDICPVNTVLNLWARKLGKEYDEGGKMAAAGSLDKELLKKLNALDFYAVGPPKSLGIEWVNQEVVPLLKNYEEDIPSILHTYCVHVAAQVARALDNEKESRVLLTGGGAYNAFLVRQLKEQSECHFTLPSNELIEFKEAIIFGLLGVLRLRGEFNVLRSVTGARKDHSSGKVWEL